MNARARLIRNLVGQQVRRIRWKRNWTQSDFISRLHDIGWNICRQRLARIEAGEARVNDIEYVVFAQALGVKTDDLLPPINGGPSFFIALSKLTGGQLKKLMSPDEILAKDSEKILSSILDKRNGHRK
ncbi:MAG TPA: helix-turn-helix transcriptional regulator [Verrucomicrobiae bacterium]|nr:helix-turn-helix transcriptional regulator [Verrucomicrobiae bacterium]